LEVIDLRSDTLTLPSPEMRRAIADAELGDDVFAEDPSVNRLQDMAAEAMGKEAGLLVSSGTQGNLIAMLAHCQRGDEVICGDQAHTLLFEAGGAWAVGGFGLRTVRNDSRGRLDPGELRAVIRPHDEHFPRTGLICLENTHNRCAGAVLSEEDLSAVRDVADDHEIPIHVDGARIFNASVSLGVPAARLADYADSITFCLSKGLGAPVGSVLCGSREFIKEARRKRKVLGGGMRQAGVIAGAGIFALENMVERLADDHENARAMAEGLSEITGVHLTPPPQTNLVYFSVDGWDAPNVVSALEENGIRCFDEGGRVRWVTRYGIDRADVDEALNRLKAVLRDGA
jgi:threonine aldolase